MKTYEELMETGTNEDFFKLHDIQSVMIMVNGIASKGRVDRETLKIAIETVLDSNINEDNLIPEIQKLAINVFNINENPKIIRHGKSGVA